MTIKEKDPGYFFAEIKGEEAQQLSNELKKADESKPGQGAAGNATKGYVNKCYYTITINFSFRAEDNNTHYGTTLPLAGTSNKRRYLCPALFGGLTKTNPGSGGGKKVTKSDDGLSELPDPLHSVSEFIRLLGIDTGATTIATWHDLECFIHQGSVKHDFIDDNFKSREFLEEKKKWFLSLMPNCKPQHAEDIINTNTPDPGAVKSFSVYQYTSDGKWYFAKANGWEKDLITLKPGENCIPILPRAVNVYIKQNVGSQPNNEWGLIWGRFYIYEEE